MKGVTRIKKYCPEDIVINVVADFEYTFKKGKVYEFVEYSYRESVAQATGIKIMKKYYYEKNGWNLTLYDEDIEKFMSMSDYRVLKIKLLLNKQK